MIPLIVATTPPHIFPESKDPREDQDGGLIVAGECYHCSHEGYYSEGGALTMDPPLHCEDGIFFCLGCPMPGEDTENDQT